MQHTNDIVRVVAHISGLAGRPGAMCGRGGSGKQMCLGRRTSECFRAVSDWPQMFRDTENERLNYFIWKSLESWLWRCLARWRRFCSNFHVVRIVHCNEWFSSFAFANKPAEVSVFERRDTTDSRSRNGVDAYDSASSTAVRVVGFRDLKLAALSSLSQL